MINIRPISDLRNNFAEISRIVHDTKEPVFLTKNGHGDMVVMSIAHYQALLNAKRVDSALLEAQRVAESTCDRYDFETTTEELRDKLARIARKDNA